MKKFFKLSVLSPIISGIVFGGLLFAFGASDEVDAPGICAIGLSVGFLLIMLGVNKTGIIRKGFLAPILLFCFSVFVIFLDSAILLDGEFEDKPQLSLIGYGGGVIMLIAGIMRMRKLKKIKNPADNQ
jgi:hypothetical protein